MHLPLMLKSSFALPPALMTISLFSDYRNGFVTWCVSCIDKKPREYTFHNDGSIVETAHVFLKTPDQLYEFAEVNLIANVSRQDRHLCILNTIYPMTNISALCSIKSTTILRDCFKAKYKKDTITRWYGKNRWLGEVDLWWLGFLLDNHFTRGQGCGERHGLLALDTELVFS